MRHALAAMLALSSAAPLLAQADTPTAQEHVARAEKLAGKDLTAPLFLCRLDGNKTIAKTLADSKTRITGQAFDNLWFLGTSFVGVWVLKTSDGLILIDSGVSTEEARDHIVPELKSFGLDPAAIKYVLVTHAHWDHFGGARYFQDRGARIGLGEPDWYLLEHEEADSPERAGRDRPHRDLVITDGQKLTLGDTTITLYVTPGHAPGMLSMIIPVREGKQVHRMSLLGGTVFPPTNAPADRHAGLLGFSQSVERLAAISRAAGADGTLNTHASVDGSIDRLAAEHGRAPGAPNPFVIGRAAVGRYYAIFDECLKAAMARPQKPSRWSDPLPKDVQP